jgi:hypothetical protein
VSQWPTVSATTVWKRLPTAKKMPLLAQALGVTTTWLVSGQEPAADVEAAQTQELAEIRAAVKDIEHSMRRVLELVERLAEHQIRFLISIGD